MRKTWKIASVFLSAIVLSILFYACSKENSSLSSIPAGKQKVNLYLTDGPGYFDSVLVDIKSVKVLVDTCAPSGSTHDDRDVHDGDNHHPGNERDWNDDHDKKDSCLVWDSLNIKPGIYNLPTLSNGKDTLLGAGNVPKGRIIMIKITLGTNNSLVKNGVHYPLNLPLGNSSSIIIKLRGDEWDEFLPGQMQLWLDFDMTRSIIQVRDGQFYLRPYIKVFVKSTSGGISGVVVPWDAYPVLTATSSADTAYGLPKRDGEFKFQGLKPGTYSLFVNASNGYKDTTLSNIVVNPGQVVNVGTLHLHK
jgi:hypothetical protein